MLAASDLHYRHAGQALPQVLEELVNPPPGYLLPWWPKLTEATGGLRAGELTVLGAPTGSGKTQLLANIACQLWEQHIPTFVAPVETGDVDFLIRMVSAMKQADWNTGRAHPEKAARELLEEYGPKFQERPLFIATYDNRVAVEDMETMLDWQVAEHGVRVALLDNLNFFLKITRSADQLIELDECVRTIGNVAKKKKIHILLICHPRKPEGKSNRITSELELKGSGSIAQEAHNVLLWNRPEEETNRPITDREAVFRKMRRRGTIYGKPFWFAYRGGRFVEG